MRSVMWLGAVFALVMGLGAAPVRAAASAGGPDRYYRQRLHWHRCTDEALVKEGARCAGVTVPLDYTRPGGRTLRIAVSRIAARDKARRRGVLLSNPGGPGASGINALNLIGDVLEPDVLARYDVIGFDPRGVERSGNRTRCGWPVSNSIRSAGADRRGFEEETALQARLAASCLAHDRARIRQLTTRNTARDMDVIRSALREKKISYYGASYGTYLGAVYAQMFPHRTDRLVLDSAIDPRRYWLGLQQDWGPAVETAFDEWASWTADRAGTYHLGATTAAVRHTVRALIARAARTPIVIEGFAFDEHLLPNVLWEMLRDSRLNAPLAHTMRTFANAADGHKPVIYPQLHQQIVADKQDEYSPMVQILCGDAPMPHDPAWYWKSIEKSRKSEPIFGPLANNIQPCAFWLAPVEPPTAVHNSIPALILQATGDNRTPYQHGVALHHQMTGSRLITLRGVRIHLVLRPGLSSCILDTTNAYFRDGTFPDNDRTCYPNAATPSPNHRAESPRHHHLYNRHQSPGRVPTRRLTRPYQPPRPHHRQGERSRPDRISGVDHQHTPGRQLQHIRDDRAQHRRARARRPGQHRDHLAEGLPQMTCVSL